MQLFRVEREVRIIIEEPNLTDDFNSLMKVAKEAFSVEDMLTDFCKTVFDKLEHFRDIGLPYEISYEESIYDFQEAVTNNFLTQTGVPADYENDFDKWNDIVFARVGQYMEMNRMLLKQLAKDVTEAITALEEFAEAMDTKLIMVTFFKEPYRHKTIAVGGYFDAIGDTRL